MPEYAWMCLYKQDSAYASHPKYAKILNMAKFWIWQGSQYASVTQRSEYARICFHRVLNMLGSKYARILNMQVLHRVLIMPHYSWIYLNRTWICLNMFGFTLMDRVLNIYHTIHRARSLYKLMSTYWEIGVFRTRQRSKMERFGKISVFFNYFCKKLNLKSLRVLNMCRVLNISKFRIFVILRQYDTVRKMLRDAIMEGFWIFQDFKYAKFLRMEALHEVLNMPGYDWIMHYDRVLNMPD